MRRDHDGHIAPQRKNEDFICGGKAWSPIPVDTVIWDSRSWTYMCRWHHGQFDNYQLHIRREDLPAEVEAYAREHLFLTRLDQRFGVSADVRHAHERFLAS